MAEIYDEIGVDYANLRQPDRRWAARIGEALGTAQRVLNVGAGAGSYEPTISGEGVCEVVALEPSSVMIAQRPADAAPVVAGVAQALPFADSAFDAALAVLTAHHWPEPGAGFAELRRVAPRQVVVTWDRDVFADFWLVRDYLPEIAEREKDVATATEIVASLEAPRVVALPVPWDCVDGFLAAYWRRPRAYLDDRVRAAISGFALLEPDVVDRGIAALGQDLTDGAWQARYAELAELDEFDAGYRLIVGGAT